MGEGIEARVGSFDYSLQLRYAAVRFNWRGCAAGGPYAYPLIGPSRLPKHKVPGSAAFPRCALGSKPPPDA